MKLEKEEEERPISDNRQIIQPSKKIIQCS